MYKYRCPECGTVSRKKNRIQAGAPPASGGGVRVGSKRTRGQTFSYQEDDSLAQCSGCSHVLTPADEVDADTVSGPPPPQEATAKKPRTSIVGRSQGAPPRVDWADFKDTDRLMYFERIDSSDWRSIANSHVRLAFNLLDTGVDGMQGFAFALPEMRNSLPLQKHFHAITEAMVENRTETSCTEGVGEAIAAVAVLRKYRGFVLESGYAPGAGIDQIWTHRTNGSLDEVIIVEAKGPGATENKNLFMPPNFQQMEPNWIIHNLATSMQAAKSRGGRDDQEGLLAAGIVRGAGLKVGKVYPGYSGASKTYYGPIEFDKSKKIITLRRVTVQAVWNADSTLGWSFSDKGTVESFVAYKKEQKYDSGGKLTVGNDAPEITYP